MIIRLITFFFLAWADRGSLRMDLTSSIVISIALFIPAVYRNMPLIKKGIFKYSKNSMYAFGFLIFWGIAIALDSKAALLACAFFHAYIWVHYFATEKPDMKYLYG